MPRESETVTRKPDVDVGTPGGPAVGGGRQMPDQAAITDMGGSGRSDAERQGDWKAGEPGRAPPALGGSSGGHSDQKAAGGPAADRKVGGGLSQPERREAKR